MDELIKISIDIVKIKGQYNLLFSNFFFKLISFKKTIVVIETK